GNYLAIATTRNLTIGTSSLALVNGFVFGNFITGANNGHTIHLVNSVGSSFQINHFTSADVAYTFDENSVINRNSFVLPDFAGGMSNFKNLSTGVTSFVGEILGGGNSVQRLRDGMSSILNTKRTNSGGTSLATWQIHTPDGKFSEFGKVSS